MFAHGPLDPRLSSSVLSPDGSAGRKLVDTTVEPPLFGSVGAPIPASSGHAPLPVFSPFESLSPFLGICQKSDEVCPFASIKRVF